MMDYTRIPEELKKLNQWVCALKVDFAKAQEAVNNCEVNLGRKNENGNCVAYKYLSHFDYIEPVVLRCKYFTLN